MWKGQKRVGVDGHCNKVDLEDPNINIVSLIEFTDMVLKEKNVMTLEISNSTGKTVFKDYTKNLKKRAGVAMSKDYLMYIMGKCEQSD